MLRLHAFVLAFLVALRRQKQKQEIDSRNLIFDFPVG